jgi:hypothetical protein
MRRAILFLIMLAGTNVFPASAATVTYQGDIKPLLGRYCYGCHGEKKKGDLDLRTFADESVVKKNPAVFEKVLDNLESQEMPPEGKPQPTKSERARITGWIEASVLGCDCNHPDPGRVTIRRLNRAEYNNTIHDLTGVNFHPADDFPLDDVGYGFDNIGDVLSLSPMLMEKYVAAAGKVMDLAMATGPFTNGLYKHFPGVKLSSTAEGGKYGESGMLIATEGEVYQTVQIPKTGEYLINVKAFGQQAGTESVRMEIRVDRRAVKTMIVTATERRPEMYEVRMKLLPGQKRISVAFLNDYYNPKDPDPDNQDRNLVVNYLEITGPMEGSVMPEPYRRIFLRQPTSGTTNEAARVIIGNFADKAFRRPVTTDELERLMGIFQMVQKDRGSFEAGIKLVLQAVLVSPNFLFRGELQADPDNPRSMRPIDDYALASRLSYFLWSSMPDDELFALAAKGKLRPNLENEVKRMLKDPKAHALVENFADQWLQIRNLAAATPDHEVFPDFDDGLRSAMASETEMFFENIMRRDRSVLEFVDADYTFLDERLAQLYGIGGVKGNEFRRVSLKGTGRGGLLTQASILTITSNPTRTSPVKRGKWVLENILGTPPPPAPPNVPPLKEGKEAVAEGTLRHRMEQHRTDPVCASCHAKMDPIGFGFENFDAIGRWRTMDGNQRLDTSGEFSDGETFGNVADLKKILLNRKRDQFAHCLAEKMLTYALGRGLERYDKCAVDGISKNLARNHYRFSALITGVVKSVPFEMRRGESPKQETAALER